MFASARAFDSAGDSAWFSATGDFNGDGKADVAVANFSSGTISVLHGNGDGTLQPAVKYAVGGDPSSIVAADCNGDGKLDLAVASTGCAPCSARQLPGGVWMLKGNGEGTFAAAVNLLPASQGSLATADFNGDGKPDLVVAPFGSSVISVLLANGDGTFKAAAVVTPGNFTGNAIAVGDVNGDGKLDIVSVDVSQGNILTLLGNGNGTFQNAVNYIPSGNPVRQIAAGDFNGDGRVDRVAASQVVGLPAGVW